MAFDQGLAQRIREVFDGQSHFPGDVVEKKMFGGLCFMLRDHMCCGVMKDVLMVRVGVDQYEECLALPHARKMDFTKRQMRGMLYVDPPGLEDDSDLESWINHCQNFINTLPPKTPKKQK